MGKLIQTQTLNQLHQKIIINVGNNQHIKNAKGLQVLRSRIKH